MPTQTNPFAAFEKFSPFANVPAAFNADVVTAFYKKNFEALAEANAVLAEGARVVAGRSSEILKQAADEASATFRGAFERKAPTDVVTSQAELVKRGIERATANARELAEIVTKAQSEAFDIVAKRVAAGIDEVAGAAKQAATETKVAGVVGFEKAGRAVKQAAGTAAAAAE